MEEYLLLCFNYIWKKVPRLPEDFLSFGQSLYEEHSYKDPASPNKAVLLKSLQRLLQCNHQLQQRGATKKNTILIDESPYKNVFNNPYNAFYPPTCTMYLEKKQKKG